MGDLLDLARERMEALALAADADSVGYWLECDGWDDDTRVHACIDVFCRAHAFRAERLLRRLRGDDDVMASGLWADVDRPERCAVCHVLLRVGLTTDGIDCVLGLTEAPPHDRACSDAEEYLLAANSMTPDDPRWATWAVQVDDLLGREHEVTRG